MGEHPILKLENVRKEYRAKGWWRRPVTFHLDADLAFDVPEIVGVMGANGAGKSTLFELMTGNNPPTRGRVTCLGQDLQQVRHDQRDRLAIHYHQSYQVRKHALGKPAWMQEAAHSGAPVVHLFDEPQFNTQDGYIGFMLDFFRRLRAEGKLVFVCLHPTAPYHLEILREICGRFLFLRRGEVTRFPDFAALMQDAGVREYLGDLAPDTGISLA